MNTFLASIEAEFRRYRALGEAALDQVSDDDLTKPGPSNGAAPGNSLAVLCWHVSGNLLSRFTDFLTSDGEKTWRQREEEFSLRVVSRAELLERWNRGWDALFEALGTLSDTDLTKSVTIRGQSLPVHEALHRALAHTSYHVGQIVYLAHALCGEPWRYLSIPPGASDSYNASASLERADAHVAKLKKQ